MMPYLLTFQAHVQKGPWISGRWQRGPDCALGSSVIVLWSCKITENIERRGRIAGSCLMLIVDVDGAQEKSPLN